MLDFDFFSFFNVHQFPFFPLSVCYYSASKENNVIYALQVPTNYKSIQLLMGLGPQLISDILTLYLFVVFIECLSLLS